MALYADPQEEWGFSLDDGQIAIVEIVGPIYDTKPTVDLLTTFSKQSSIKAIVLQINSPGGGAAASQEIYREVQRAREEFGKKVVASMSSVAASGGYYIACGAEVIVANPATITGSIGVLAEWVNWGDLMAWAKLKNVLFKSGEFKDTGNPTRSMTDDERQYFQGLIDNLYEQFVEVVAEGRKMSVEDVKPLADGRIFTGEDALSKGLIDELGTLQDAVKIAARLVNIKGNPRLVVPKKKKTSLLDLLTGNAPINLPIASDPSQSHIRFEYLWR